MGQQVHSAQRCDSILMSVLPLAIVSQRAHTNECSATSAEQTVRGHTRVGCNGLYYDTLAAVAGQTLDKMSYNELEYAT